MRVSTMFSALMLGGLTAAAGLASPVAFARPPEGSASQPKLVGKVLTRDGVLDLTVLTLAEGGPAHELAKGLAGVMADADVARNDRAAPHASPTPCR